MFTAPLWWFILSGVCFGISILFNIVLVAGMIVAWGKISPLLSEVRQQVHVLGDKTADIASTAKETVENVHDRAEAILGNAQQSSAQVTKKVGAASAAITALFVGLRVVGFVRGLLVRRQHPPMRHVTA